MRIKFIYDLLKGFFETNEVKMLCLPNEKEGKVELSFKEKSGGWYNPIGAVKLYSKDSDDDFKATLEDATYLGNEIARRWNECPQWRDVSDDQFPTDEIVLCRTVTSHHLVAGYLYKDFNGIYRVRMARYLESSPCHEAECDMYMLIPEVPSTLLYLSGKSWRWYREKSFSLNGRHFTDEEVRKVLAYGLKNGYRTMNDFKESELINLLGWEK